MNAGKEIPSIPGWVKVAAVLILLASLLLGGILAAPFPVTVQALNFPQIDAPHVSTSSGVNGTLASFTALIPEFFTVHLPIVER
jgi:hypothetical protein